jgi:hypothetical protein
MGSNPAENGGFSRAIKICGMTSFGRKVKLQASSCTILQHVKDPLRYDRY